MIKNKNMTFKVVYIIILWICSALIVLNAFSKILLANNIFTVKNFNDLLMMAQYEPMNSLLVVRMIAAFSDFQVTFLKVYDVITFKDIVAPAILLLLYNVNSNYIQNKHIKRSVVMYYVILFIEIVIFILTVSLLATESINILYGLGVYAILLMITGILTVFIVIYMLYGTYNFYISNEED